MRLKTTGEVYSLKMKNYLLSVVPVSQPPVRRSGSLDSLWLCLQGWLQGSTSLVNLARVEKGKIPTIRW